MKVVNIRCDLCKRDTGVVNDENFSGGGSLKFYWSLGGNSGGVSNEIVYDDLCRDCTHMLKIYLEQKEKQIAKEMKELK